MGKYLSLYQNKEDYNDNKDTHLKPHVSYIVNPITEIIYIPKPFYINQYFTIVALEDGLTAKLSINACEYCIDNGEWTTLAVNTATPQINSGQKISFKITNPRISSSYNPYGIGTFTVNKSFNVEGNIMSLLYGDNFEGQINLSGKKYAFSELFKNCTTLQNAENLILPATILADKCYYSMFYKCTSLTIAPELPATTLVYGCYYCMFYNCKSLRNAPELPATTLAGDCYESMFSGCTSLISAPELPAMTLSHKCYSYMFSGCTGLTIPPKLPATTLEQYCYYYMFSGCTSLTTAPELPVITLAGGCYAGMFIGCINLTIAPKLPATTLASSCYANMFQNCTGLISAPELSVTTLASACYNNMFNGCTSLTAAPELPATTLATICYQAMFFGCSKLNYIKMLAKDISASNCLNNWVSGVSSTGTFVKHPDMAFLPSGTGGIPSGWTVEDYTQPV